MKKRFLVFLLLSSSILFFSCMSNRIIRKNLIPLKSKQELVMVIFGDSVSGGFGVKGIRDSYGGILKTKISELFNCPVSFINSSRADESYMFGSRRQQSDILSYRPDITFVMLGLVDAFEPGILLSTHETNLDKFYSVLKKSDTFVIVLTTTGLRDIKDNDDSRLIALNEFNQIVKNTAQNYHLPFIDVAYHMERLRLADPLRYTSLFDGPFLLNEKGNEFVADIIFRSIEKNFTEDIDSDE